MGILPQDSERRQHGTCQPTAGRCLPMPMAAPVMRLTRPVISRAARRENVSNKIRCGSMPLTTRWATRWARVLVLPEPAPAITSSGRVDRRAVNSRHV